jgi:hypothetical protein
MNVETSILNKKLELIQWLSTVEDLNVIEKIQDLRNTLFPKPIHLNHKKSTLKYIILMLK